jgi:predicted DNA-binding protein (MmcQ/YjbR family)
MAKTLLDRIRRICANLPDVEESSRLGGQPHFYVRGKIFTGCGVEHGVWSCGMKVGLELQSLLITRPGITIAKYVGRYGWISVEERALADDAELERLIVLSYGLIAGEPERRPGAKKTAVTKAQRKTTKKATKQKANAKPRASTRRR